MKAIKLAVLALCFALPFRPSCAQAQQQTFNGTVVMKNATGHVVVNQSGQMQGNLQSQYPWVGPGSYTTSFYFPYTPLAQPPVPVMPGTAPAYVTDCPNLAFSDSFHYTDQSWISNTGPIQAPVKWIVHKADGYDFGDAYYDGVPNGSDYVCSSNGVALNLHNWYRSYSQAGDGVWRTGNLSSLAYAKGGAVNGQSTGFEASAPSYWEVAVWIAPLQPGDAPGISGLWPSVSLYTDPAVLSTVGYSVEYDLFELYSIDYTIPHCSWHKWSPSGQQLAAYGSTFSHGAFPDLSAGWHIWGLWIDTATTHWYLDGQEIFTQPTETTNAVYIMLTNASGGGFPFMMSPSQVYPYQVAYVACWAH